MRGAYGALAVMAGLMMASPVRASEAGGGVYPNGAEGVFGGALPPKGLYYQGYLQYYEAGRFNDGDGKAGLLPDFKVKVDARIAGMTGNRSGVPDVTIDPIIMGWHFRNGLHVITGLDINLPVGSYDRHYWNVEPVLVLAYYKKNLRRDVKMMYDINFKNTDARINGFNPTGAGYRTPMRWAPRCSLASRAIITSRPRATRWTAPPPSR